MRLLVTGGCGFIGAGFCRRILADFPWIKMVNLDCLYPCSTVATDLVTSRDGYVFVQGDIKDRALVDKLLRDHQIDTIVHFAAQSHVDTSFTDPMLYTHDNVVGTHTLLEASRMCGHVWRFVHISTDEVYGQNNHGDGAFTETSLLKPTNPYAASKAAAEMFVNSYVHSYGFPAVIIRSNNVYGPGQYPEKVIPKFLFNLFGGRPVTIQGSGRQLRSFLHIDDAVDAVLCVLFDGQIGEVYNISSRDEISIRDLAERLVRTTIGADADLREWIRYGEDRHFNDQRYWITSEPLERLGWKQQVDLETGLQRTIDWFRAVDRRAYWADTSGTIVAPAPVKRALIWGDRGWIGGLFRKVLEGRGWEVIGARSRADSREAVMDEVRAVAPSHMVSLIGRTHGPGFGTIDYLEQPGKLAENLRDNLYGPITLASVARDTKLHMMYMGTGCIFQYDAAHPRSVSGEAGSGANGFSETALPNFFGSSYSTVKGYTDRVMEEMFGDTCLNVRIRMPISSEDNPRNFISKIIAYPKICSIPNSMTVLDDMLPCLATCMERGTVGTLNATNPGVIDHHTILTWYKDLQNPAHTWTEVSNEELVATLVKGARSNNCLDTTRLETLCPEIPPIHDSVRRLLEAHRFAGRET